jgi:uncharacterized protein DUF1592/uncharacterized protein DUF1595/uncharacterized protein DUF1588
MRTTNTRFVGLLTAAACLGAVGCSSNLSGPSSRNGDTTGNGDTNAGTSSGSSGGSAASNSGSSGGTAGGSSGGTAPSSGSSSGSTDGGSTASACAPLPTITRRLWRLSAEQWGNAVQTLLGLPAAPVLTSRGGEAGYAFFSDVSLQVDSDMQFNMYTLSQAALTQIDPTVTTTIAPCTGTTAAAQTACATTFLQTFAPKAYRRPLDPSELTNLMTVYAQGAMQDYKTGIELLIQAIIISPSFIYRTELGPSTLTVDANGNYPSTTLTPYEVASQLGFTLLGTLPDDALMAAAANGDLGTTAGITTQINRLLALPAVQANLTNIVLGWFNIGQMFSKTKDTSLLAALSTTEQDQAGIESDLLTSTQDFVNGILWNGSGKIDDLLTSQTVYVNQRLATLFPGVTYAGQMPTSDTTFVPATWPASQGRSGILTQPSYLWSASDPSLTSIVKRGKGIHDNVICQDSLGSPVDLSTPSAKNVIACKSPDGTQTLSTCDSEILQSDARMTFQPCKTCHSQMDPYARVLQNFGPIGNYRTVDEANRPIDPTATFVPSSPLAPQTITGVQAFTQALVATGVIDGCSVQQMASYAIGSAIQIYNTCEIGPIRTQIDGSVKSLFSNVLLADFMRARAGGTQ